MKDIPTDLTDMETEEGRFPRRLSALGFHLMRVGNEPEMGGGEPTACWYIQPPMITIPGGPFLMGSDQPVDRLGYQNESPQHVVTLETFELGQYPVTEAEYKLFLASWNGHNPSNDNPLEWRTRVPADDGFPRGDGIDHPATRVSWEGAMAYAKWLSSLTGQPYCLATEAQWEKAARGTDGRIYPWGNEPHKTYGNIETHRVSPIGAYPQGVSPYGVHDMAGNVLEWTTSTFFSYPYSADDGREDLGPRPMVHSGGCFDNSKPKVMRGGSCDNDIWYSRATCRMPSDFPDWPGEHGFRLARWSRPAYRTIDPCPCGRGASHRICHGVERRNNDKEPYWSYVPYNLR